MFMYIAKRVKRLTLTVLCVLCILNPKIKKKKIDVHCPFQKKIPYCSATCVVSLKSGT